MPVLVVMSGLFLNNYIFLQKGALINALDKNSITPLILAANQSDVNITRYLIKNGAHVNLKDRMNSTALDYACMRLRIDIAKELVMNGCSCSPSTPFSFFSPLKHLIVNKYFEVAKMLIEAGSIKINLCVVQNYLDSANEKDQTEQEREFFVWLKNYMQVPQSLMSLSRSRIRHVLKNKYFEEKVNSLNVPKFIKDFLMMRI